MHDMAVTRERVAEQLKALRELHGRPGRPLSQAKAARQAGVDERQWRRWEGQETLAGHPSLEKIAEGFDIPLEVFDDGREDRSGLTLGERLDAIEAAIARLTESLLPPEPEAVAREIEQASESAPSAPAGKAASTPRTQAARRRSSRRS